MDGRAAASGRQVELRAGAARAVVVEVGAGLRQLSLEGGAVIDGYGPDEPCPSARGAHLIPWPNRLRQGLYTFDGEQQRLPVNEWSLGNASHGITRWHAWQLEPEDRLEGHRDDAPRDAVPSEGNQRETQPVEREQGRSSARWRMRLHPSPGYPFLLDLAVTYALRPDGLDVTVEAVNAGEKPAPFAYGAHPYLMAVPTGPSAGADAPTRTVDGDRLTVPARTALQTDATLVPVGRVAVDGTPLHFAGEPIGDRQANTTYTDLVRDADGVARARLVAADASRTVEVWQDEALAYQLVYTGDAIGGRARQSVAIEPMSAPPNAFSSGEAVVRLGPGDSWTARWGIVLR